jgi:hypothetical protein
MTCCFFDTTTVPLSVRIVTFSVPLLNTPPSELANVTVRVGWSSRSAPRRRRSPCTYGGGRDHAN